MIAVARPRLDGCPGAGRRGFVALAVLALILAACSSGSPNRSVAHHRPRPPATTVPPTPAGKCHASSLDPAQALPDRFCTPGVANPAVTQATIHQTICVKGWTATIRPPVGYTSALKRTQIVAYGYKDRNPAHYEEDHLVSLELGGAPTDPANLWPEPGRSPNPKDTVENRLRQEVCSGMIPLATAQRAISTDWRVAP